MSTHLVLNTGGWWGARREFLESSVDMVFETLLEYGYADKKIIFHLSGMPSETKDHSCGPTAEPLNSVNELSERMKKVLDMNTDLLHRLRLRWPRINFLDTLELSSLRVDAHPGSPQDCQHWTLPGVPDAWNSIMLNCFFG
jgi:hypothetical protein